MYEDKKLNQTFELSDGRKLGFAEFGDLNGSPLFHFMVIQDPDMKFFYMAINQPN